MRIGVERPGEILILEMILSLSVSFSVSILSLA